MTVLTPLWDGGGSSGRYAMRQQTANRWLVMLALVSATVPAHPEVLTGRYRCGQQGVQLGLPKGVFTVRYLRTGENGTAIVPVSGRHLSFTQGLSADGGRYLRGHMVWWDAREPSFSLGREPHDTTVYCKHAD